MAWQGDGRVASSGGSSDDSPEPPHHPTLSAVESSSDGISTDVSSEDDDARARSSVNVYLSSHAEQVPDANRRFGPSDDDDDAAADDNGIGGEVGDGNDAPSPIAQDARIHNLSDDRSDTGLPFLDRETSPQSMLDPLEPLRLIGPCGGMEDGKDEDWTEFLNFDADFADLLKAIGDENGQEAPEPGHSQAMEDGGAAEDVSVGHCDVAGDDCGRSDSGAIVADADFDDAIATLQVEGFNMEGMEFAEGDSFEVEGMSDAEGGGCFDLQSDDGRLEGYDSAFEPGEDFTDLFDRQTLESDLSEALGVLSLDVVQSSAGESKDIFDACQMMSNDVAERPSSIKASHEIDGCVDPNNRTSSLELGSTTSENSHEDALASEIRMAPEKEEHLLLNKLPLNDLLDGSMSMEDNGFDLLVCGECTPMSHRVFPDDENREDGEGVRPALPNTKLGTGIGKPASFVLNGQLKHKSKSGADIGGLGQISEHEEDGDDAETGKEVKHGSFENRNHEERRRKSKGYGADHCDDTEEVDPFEAAIAADIAKQRIDLEELLKLSLLSLKDPLDGQFEDNPIPIKETHGVSSVDGALKKKTRTKSKVARKETNGDGAERRNDHDARCGQQRRFRSKQSKSDNANNTNTAQDTAARFAASFGPAVVPDHERFGATSMRPISDEGSDARERNLRNERSCLGHCDTVFGLSFSPDGSFLATASKDATVRIWHVETNSLACNLFGHDKNNGCLRVAWAPALSWGCDSKCHESEKAGSGRNLPLLASGGADGNVKTWSLSIEGGDDSRIHGECIGKINHSSIQGANGTSNVDMVELDGNENGLDNRDDEASHVYSLQFIEDWRFGHGKHLTPSSGHDQEVTSRASEIHLLLTSSDEFLHLWEPFFVDDESFIDSGAKTKGHERSIDFKPFLCLRFGQLSGGNGGVAIHSVAGRKGPPISHNGSNLDAVYVFDASYCSSNHLLGAALSDGSLRLINARGFCVSILQLPGCASNITSFAWDFSGTRLASSVATGHIILWDVDVGSIATAGGYLGCSCRAVLEGGHDRGRPVFGAKYCGRNAQEILLTWGSDGKLCLWDSSATGQISRPLAVLIAQQNFPLYCLDVYESSQNRQKATSGANDGAFLRSTIAIGGGCEVTPIGIPVQLYDVPF